MVTPEPTRGETGETGATGARGVRGKTGRSGLMLTDRRLLVIFLLFMAVMVYVTVQANNFQSQIADNCRTTDVGFQRVNTVLQKIADTQGSVGGRSEQEKADLAEFYSSLRLPISRCP